MRANSLRLNRLERLRDLKYRWHNKHRLAALDHARLIGRLDGRQFVVGCRLGPNDAQRKYKTLLRLFKARRTT